MFTLDTLKSALGMTTWTLDGNNLPERTLYLTPAWVIGFNNLPGPRNSQQLTRDLSIRGRVSGLATRFVAGDTWNQMLVSKGDGSEPIFRRMRKPNECVVEMRTVQTRTFGFFARTHLFVACSIVLTDLLKAEGNAGYLRHAADVQKLISRLSPSEYDCTTDVRSLIAK